MGLLFVIALRINEIEQLVALHGIRLGKKPENELITGVSFDFERSRCRANSIFLPPFILLIVQQFGDNVEKDVWNVVEPC